MRSNAYLHRYTQICDRGGTMCPPLGQIGLIQLSPWRGCPLKPLQSFQPQFLLHLLVPIVFFGLVRLYVLELGYIVCRLLLFFLGILMATILLWHPLFVFKNDHHCRKLLRQTTIWGLLSLLSVRLSPSQWKYPCQRPCCRVSWWWWWWLRIF